MTKNSLSDKLAFFKKVLLFHNLNDEQIKKIISIMKTREVKQGEVICQENAHEDSLFILLKGEVEISKRLLLPLVQDPSLKQEKSLVILSERQYPFFGEMALFEETPERSASITALKPCTLVVVEKSDLLEILHKDPKIGSIIYKNIATELTHRLIKVNRDILKLTTAFSLAIEGE
jgi:CRP/FNR family cyclic AMP-dependent transcriptional regulator